MRAKIKDIIPGATYGCDVFTQTVVVQLEDGTDLRIEDPTMQCGNERAGTEAEISISADIATSVQSVSNGPIKMEPVDPEEGPGIESLRTEVQGTQTEENKRTSVTLSLPAGEMTITFNSKRLPDDLPTNYEPAIGDWLEFKKISGVR